jgi:hypothetical protein
VAWHRWTPEEDDLVRRTRLDPSFTTSEAAAAIGLPERVIEYRARRLTYGPHLPGGRCPCGAKLSHRRAYRCKPCEGRQRASVMTAALERALAVIRRRPGLTSYQLAEELGCVQSGGHRKMQKLRDLGLIHGFRHELRAVD